MDLPIADFAREGKQKVGPRMEFREELKRLRWTAGDLKQRAKSDPAKLAVAARLRRETTLTIRWIAGRLHLGSWKSLNAKLTRRRKTNEKDAQ